MHKKLVYQKISTRLTKFFFGRPGFHRYMHNAHIMHIRAWKCTEKLRSIIRPMHVHVYARGSQSNFLKNPKEKPFYYMSIFVTRLIKKWDDTIQKIFFYKMCILESRLKILPLKKNFLFFGHQTIFFRPLTTLRSPKIQISL